MKVAIFPPQYFGCVGYYAAMSDYDLVVIDYGMRFDKRQKSVHRTSIADARGSLLLTLPISHGAEVKTWSDIIISAHSNWWDVQRGAIESAYGRTPFFEFYFDRFKSFFSAQIPGSRLVNHLAAIDAVIRDILDIKTRVSATLPPNINPDDVADLRKFDFSQYPSSPYPQIRADRLGFIPNLSVIDKIFNAGVR